MPYKDPAKKREWERNYRRLQRAGMMKSNTDQPRTLIKYPEVRIETARDYLGVINAMIDEVRNAPDATIVERARVIGYLIGVGLKALEIGALEERLSVIEKELQATSKPLNWKTAVV
jgi:hypothetical protein